MRGPHGEDNKRGIGWGGRSFPVREKKINKGTTETGLIMEFYS